MAPSTRNYTWDTFGYVRISLAWEIPSLQGGGSNAEILLMRKKMTEIASGWSLFSISLGSFQTWFFSIFSSRDGKVDVFHERGTLPNMPLETRFFWLSTLSSLILSTFLKYSFVSISSWCLESFMFENQTEVQRWTKSDGRIMLRQILRWFDCLKREATIQITSLVYLIWTWL